MSKKPKNWEELVNDGEQYGDITSELTPNQKIIFENIKDQKVLKLDSSFDYARSQILLSWDHHTHTGRFARCSH